MRPIPSLGTPHLLILADSSPQQEEEEWQRTAEEVQRTAALYRETLDQTLPVEAAKKKPKSAKSHIFRRDKVSAE